jgi:HK97 family phage major capsid protein
MEIPDLGSRVLALDLHRADSAAMTIPCSLSSEEPCTRTWGIEVLGHNPEEIDLSRAVNGTIPMLASHDYEEIPRPGNVEKIRVQNGRLRGVLRFAPTDRGRELWTAVQDGFLDGVSVSYRLNELKQTGMDEPTGLPIYRATNWTLLEASVCNLPADHTVGIGRSRPAERTLMDPNNPIPGNPRIEVIEDHSERKRCSEIMAIGQRVGLQDQAQKAVSEGWSLDQFRGVVVSHLEARSGGTPGDPLPNAPVRFLGRELNQYSLTRGILALCSKDWSDAGFEREVSREAGKRNGRESEGLLIPLEVLTRTITKAGAGANLIGTDHLGGEFIDVLRPVSVAIAAGARILTGLVGNISIPRLVSGSTGYWVDEAGVITESTPVPDAVTMQPKTVGGIVEVTRKMLLQSSPEVETLLQSDLTSMIGTALDRVGLQGGGSNEPSGVLETVGIGSVSVSDAPMSWASTCELIGEIVNDNALSGSLAFVTTPKCHARMLATAKDPGSGGMLWEAAAAGSQAHGIVAGYPAFSTSNCPSTLGAGNLHACIFGNWADLLIGQWGVLEVTVNPYESTAFTKGNVYIRAMIDVDVAVRHAESFAACQDIDPTAV